MAEVITYNFLFPWRFSGGRARQGKFGTQFIYSSITRLRHFTGPFRGSFIFINFVCNLLDGQHPIFPETKIKKIVPFVAKPTCFATYLSCSLSTWKVRSITVVICKPRIMNVKGFGLSTAMIWQSLTVKLLRGSPMARAFSGLFLKPTNEPSSSRRKYRALQFFICSPANHVSYLNILRKRVFIKS